MVVNLFSFFFLSEKWISFSLVGKKNGKGQDLLHYLIFPYKIIDSNKGQSCLALYPPS